MNNLKKARAKERAYKANLNPATRWVVMHNGRPVKQADDQGVAREYALGVESMHASPSRHYHWTPTGKLMVHLVDHQRWTGFEVLTVAPIGA